MAVYHSTVTLKQNEQKQWVAECRENEDGKALGLWRSVPTEDMLAAKLDQDMHTYNPGTVRGHRDK